MADPTPKHVWFYPTPGKLLAGLFFIECILWLSERFKWFPINQHKGWMVLICVATVGIFVLLMFLWMVVALLFRFRFQFSIRSLLVMVAVVALACSWFAVELKRAREQKLVVDALEKAGLIVYLDSPFLNLPITPESPWHYRLIGWDFLYAPSKVSSNHKDIFNFFENHPGLSSEPELGTGDYQLVDDEVVSHLRGLVDLRYVILDCHHVTRRSLPVFASLPKLEVLQLFDADVTDLDLAELMRARPTLKATNYHWSPPATTTPSSSTPQK